VLAGNPFGIDNCDLPRGNRDGERGVQDVAAAWVAYREGCRSGVGGRFDLSGAAMVQ